MTVPLVPVGHYLGLVHDDETGTARHRVRVGMASQPLEPAVEAPVWFAAHEGTVLPLPTGGVRDRLRGVLPHVAMRRAVTATLLNEGMLAEVDAGFADRYQVLPLTYGRGWQTDDSLALGAGERTVCVDETVLAVWERGAEHPTLRAACAAAAPAAPGAALAAFVGALHRLLRVHAVYVDVADQRRHPRVSAPGR
ncbi:hypothetical protein Daura_23620 [Dactylosporangium aurantiacum]|uniref:Uncharacterized protein n=1 Tax=Dactylosporangium aurantiacum TaxID=35754 RepID=A0A9Q9IT28_9ACTN|nr:hypothetical protein [Dactylosporangium aurantiacum]MDG6103921.1 hypothetical protein [Dactylosporangium aurantiacum]UWZ58890.1 hypothetical protein Daura_23620 [Dactylosporangium aurantiacum]